MKTAALVVRILLGLVFTVFGLNGLLHFMPNMPLPDAAKPLLGGMMASGYMFPLLAGTQVVAGVLLLVGLFVPLALALLAPVIVNIFFFHLFLAPGGLGLAAVIVIFELFLVWVHRAAFAPMLRPRAA